MLRMFINFAILIVHTKIDWNLINVFKKSFCVSYQALTLNSKYHGCWHSGFLCRQDINTHDIDYVE